MATKYTERDQRTFSLVLAGREKKKKEKRPGGGGGGHKNQFFDI
jgi:hypothetical protein